jgi:hypothetical protein
VDQVRSIRDVVYLGIKDRKMSFIRKIDYLKIILCNSGFGMYLNKIIKVYNQTFNFDKY